METRKKWLAYLFIGFGTVGFMILLVIGLLVIDYWHETIDQWVEGIFNTQNHFSGEVWFSAILTCIASAPGIFCGWFAIYQTERINKLESRYHRPALSLRNGEIIFYWLNWIDKSQEYLEVQSYFKQIKEHGHYNYAFRLNLEFEVKNEVEVKSFQIEEIAFLINKERYNVKVDNEMPQDLPRDRKMFSRSFKSDKIVYRCEWDIYPLTITTEDESKGEFWESLESFVNYKSILREDFRYLEVVVSSQIIYEYSGDQAEKILCRLMWNAAEGTGRIDQFYGTQKTENGFFSYDIKG